MHEREGSCFLFIFSAGWLLAAAVGQLEWITEPGASLDWLPALYMDESMSYLPNEVKNQCEEAGD
jgi:hypothetical protein